MNPKARYCEQTIHSAFFPFPPGLAFGGPDSRTI